MKRNHMAKHVSIWGLSAVALALAAPAAHAATAASNFTVSANVIAACSISTVNMSFGNYEPTTTHASTSLTVNGAVTITCARGTATWIDLSPGSNSANATGTTRAMAGGGSYLSYELYQDNSLTTLWGTGNPGNAFVPAVAPNRNPRTFTIYGRIPAGQDTVPVGSYSDSITATVNF